MSSLLTNTTALIALRNLASTQSALTRTQHQVSSGLRVAEAADSEAYWSISTTMKARIGALSAVNDSLDLGTSIVDVANSAVTQIIDNLDKMSQLLTTAQTPGVDHSVIDQGLSVLQTQIRSVAASASFNGVNLLQTDNYAYGTVSHRAVPSSAPLSLTVSASSNSSAAGTVDLSLPIALYGASGSWTPGDATYGLLESGWYHGVHDQSMELKEPTVFSGYSVDTMQTSTLSSIAGTTAHDGTPITGDLPTMIDSERQEVLNVRSFLIGYATDLGGAKTVMTTMKAFNSALSDAITSGVGSLVDADMNVASTKLQAQQTQQQLSIQALSIANQNSQLVLKLFGG